MKMSIIFNYSLFIDLYLKITFESFNFLKDKEEILDQMGYQNMAQKDCLEL